jgi:hypothetical protein
MAAGMAAPPEEPSLSGQQRSALALLDSILHGVTADQLVLVHGFDRDMSLASSIKASQRRTARRLLAASPSKSFA